SGAPPPTQVAVPNVVGETEAAATSAITSAGLTAGTVTMQSSATVASGSVISESPAAGTSVAMASAVNLVVSSGAPGRGRAAAADVVGETEAAGTCARTCAGFADGA